MRKKPPKSPKGDFWRMRLQGEFFLFLGWDFERVQKFRVLAEYAEAWIYCWLKNSPLNPPKGTFGECGCKENFLLLDW